MKRRELLKSIGMVTASSVLPAAANAAAPQPTKAPAAKRPNILVFLSDDHAQIVQQSYGNSEARTPNMARIADNGVRMTNAFTTCPVCSPARASFFTGRVPSQHGIHDWILEPDDDRPSPNLNGQVLISDLIQKAGYHTALIGKWHCGEDKDPHSGFDYWYSFWKGQYPHVGEQTFSDNGKHVTPTGIQSALFTDEVVGFLKNHYADSHTKEQPFFLFVGYTDTHSPHNGMPDDLVAEFKDATFRDIPQEQFSKAHGTAVMKPAGDPAKEKERLEEYYASAACIDRSVGRVLDQLQQMGVLEDTLVVYTGDHGLNIGQHGVWEKGNATVPQNFLEESIRVPCAISWPKGGIQRNLKSDVHVNHCDLFMTLLEVAGATPDAKTAQSINSPGRSYLSHLRGDGTKEDSDRVICEYGNARMIRKDGYKLILRYPFEGVIFPNELYDLKADPRETVNIYTEARYAPLIQSLSSELDAFYATHTVAGHSGLDLAHQPAANKESPWLKAIAMNLGTRT
jgi:arylsulfatase A-like enzyme